MMSKAHVWKSKDARGAAPALAASFALFACFAAGTGCTPAAVESGATGGARTHVGGSRGTSSETGGTWQISAGSGGSQGSGGTSESENSGGRNSGGTGGVGGSAEGGGGDAGGGTSGTSVAIENVPAGAVCARLSELQCEAEASCCKSPGHSVQVCKTTMAKKCAEVYLDQVSSSSLSGYSPRATGLAMAEFQQRAVTCDPSIVAWGASVSGLRGIFPGTQSQGTDCTPKSLLDGGDAAAHLMACRNPAETACLPGNTWKCMPRSSAGGACFSDTNCQDGLYCDNPQTALVGATCKARKALGASCRTGSQCSSLVCKGAVCVSADSQTVYCLND